MLMELHQQKPFFLTIGTRCQLRRGVHPSAQARRQVARQPGRLCRHGIHVERVRTLLTTYGSRERNSPMDDPHISPPDEQKKVKNSSSARSPTKGPPVMDWSKLRRGDSVQIWLGKYQTGEGRVDCLTADLTTVWIMVQGAPPRRMIHRDGPEEIIRLRRKPRWITGFCPG